MQTKERLSPKSLISRTREYIPAPTLSQPGLRPMADWIRPILVDNWYQVQFYLAARAFSRCFGLLLRRVNSWIHARLAAKPFSESVDSHFSITSLAVVRCHTERIIFSASKVTRIKLIPG